MKRLSLLLLSLFYPAILFAQDSSGGGSLSFAPPPGDLSVVFLGNIFGIVDGVLHGSGSQIMGTMFGVFNAAVLALGGIVIMYTLTVSTMNTAQEGQLLGQRWSSIWVPVRSTLGLALLIPKASGYCMMQIFIMWVVVQGVGAADKIWDAALGYLNRGGVIIQAQMEPATSLTASGSNVAKGAMIILSGQVCMAGLQQILYEQRQSLLNQKANKSGPCYGTPSNTMKKICDNQVPDFIATVNAVAVQSKNKGGSEFTVPMPNFDSTSPYSKLKGICGTIHWNGYAPSGSPVLTNAQDLGVGKGNMETIQLSRAIAIQQMYSDLASVAQRMVNNDPQLSTSQTTDSGQNNFSDVAQQQFGVPYNLSGNVCSADDVKNNQCVSWGSDPSSEGTSPLFNGTSFQGAVQDYNSVMLPSLNLAKQAKSKSSAKKSREFINKAEEKGWILAGSYFWDIVKLNQSQMGGSQLTDSDTGLGTSSFSAENLVNPFSKDKSCSDPFSELCTWLNGDSTQVKQLKGLIDGSFTGSQIDQPDAASAGSGSAKELLNQTSARKPWTGDKSSTVYGFIDNSLKVKLPDQPGFKPPSFNLNISIDITTDSLTLQKQSFDCGSFFGFCIGRWMGKIIYNDIIRNIYNMFLRIVNNIINTVILAFLSVPLQGMAQIFRAGVAVIEQPAVNPIIALANMGSQYINFANEMWLLLLEIAISVSLIPVFGAFIWALIALAGPLMMAWMSVMISVGFMTAYYIPFVPYMIFTFGTIGWLMAVIEAMVAGPIVALGVTHPEGNEALGKGEQALMIILNVFLRPAMMIIGYIAAIALSYVSVWLLNEGFQQAASFIQGGSASAGFSASWSGSPDNVKHQAKNTSGYSGWAGIYGFFFVILTYTTLYMIVVQRSFSLITMLPDGVLRFIGGQRETFGEQTAQWGEELKGKQQEAAKGTEKSRSQIDSKLGAYGQQAVGKVAGVGKGMSPSSGGTVSASGGAESTDSGEE